MLLQDLRYITYHFVGIFKIILLSLELKQIKLLENYTEQRKRLVEGAL